MEDLFGSEDEGGDAAPAEAEAATEEAVAEEAPATTVVATTAVVEGAHESEGALQEPSLGADQRVVGGPIDVYRYRLPTVDARSGARIVQAKMPQSIGVQPEQFDSKLFFEDGSPEDSAEQTPAAVANVIRWRTVIDESGLEKKESNARIVKWSDGTYTLHVGSFTVPVHHQEIPNPQYLYSYHCSVLQQIGPMSTKFVIRAPTNAAAVKAAAQPQRAKVKLYSTLENPEVTKQKREREENDAIAARERRFSRTRRREQSLGLSEGLLESSGGYDDEDEDGEPPADEGGGEDRADDDAGEGDEAGAVANEGRPAKRRRRSLDADEEREAEQRMLQAKHGGVAVQRRSNR
eukprot:TRINITY_DN17288_c0_g1_i1.p1 TRINITY_DN17288_c0_g1~~TRINITY_DN17288_c0_g1_i1.p1  ORF type:complete len:359 (+),score=92.67 TRINITY_DN17288_c0_g1_i1:31-1077(+)